jgi:pimeloyl-ACP methyl ester carboxylesterase
MPGRTATVDAATLIRNARDAGGPALDSLVDALRAEIGAVGTDPVSIVAESVFATTALRFAAAYPDRVDELVLVAPYGYTSVLTAGRRLPTPFAAAVRGLYSGSEAATAQSLDVLAGRQVAGDENILRSYIASATDSRVAESADVLAEWIESGEFELAALESGDHVRGVKQQVSLIWGRDDLWAGLDSAFYLARRLKNVRLRVFPHTGHLVSLEVPEEVARHVLSAVDSAATRGSQRVTA